MTIRVLHTEASKSWGGQHMRTFQEMKGMEKYGVETFLACPPDSLMYRKAIEQKLPVYPIPFKWNGDLVSAFKLFQLIRKLKIDILNSHSGKDMWIGGFTAKLARIKFIRTQHHPKSKARFRLHFMYRLADHVIPTGANVRKELINEYGLKAHRVSAIPSGQDQERFSAENFNRAEERARLNLTSDNVAIGTLGFLSKRKGIFEFLDAAKNLYKRQPDFRFFLIGSGRPIEQVKKFIKENDLHNRVYALGHMDDPAPYLAALDIFVMASHEESGPQTLMQAMLMELPAVATRDVGSVPDLYDDNMLLFDAKDTEGLEEALEKMGTDFKLRKKLSSKARRPAIEKFSETTMFNRLMKVYDQVLLNK